MTEQATTNRLGEVLRDGDRIGLRYERVLAHAPSTVWAAITEPEHLRHWFPADMIGPREAGAKLQFKFWQSNVEYAAEELDSAGVDLADPVIDGELVTWEPPHVVEFVWGSERLRFDLAATDSGTRLVLTVTPGGPAPRGVEGTATGYHVCLDSLEKALAGKASAMPDKDVFARLEAEYAQLIAAG